MSIYSLKVETDPNISEEAKDTIRERVSIDLSNNTVSLFDLSSLIERCYTKDEIDDIDLPTKDLEVLEILLEKGISHIEV